MQADDKNITLEGGGIVALPETKKVNGVRTSNLVLKRKNDSVPSIGKIKMIKNSTDILVRDVVP